MKNTLIPCPDPRMSVLGSAAGLIKPSTNKSDSSFVLLLSR
jgi:hypothetical protein